MAGQSIRITAKVESKDKPKSRHRGKAKDRNLQISGTGGITIKAKQNHEPSPRKKKEYFGASMFEKNQDEVDYNDYKKLKQARLAEQQRTLYSPWKIPVPITDRLDGPIMEPRRTPQTSTKVTITNLHPSVTRQDVEELFGVVGVLKSCKMLQPGTAEVVYTVKEDAITAYARYHNRNLDGQPMQCKLSASQTLEQAQTTQPKVPLRQAAPPSPKLFHAPVQPYVPSKMTSMPAPPLSRPVVFKVKI
ncbi:hypothetical protein QZH41_005311 [Actinostola sp. cb2023]|nr:hypothetical protein QZH41_005311 [Actinostola sp. cb2023]